MSLLPRTGNGIILSQTVQAKCLSAPNEHNSHISTPLTQSKHIHIISTYNYKDSWQHVKNHYHLTACLQLVHPGLASVVQTLSTKSQEVVSCIYQFYTKAITVHKNQMKNFVQ